MCIIYVNLNYASLLCRSSVLARGMLSPAGCYNCVELQLKLNLSIVQSVPLVCNGNFYINKTNVLKYNVLYTIWPSVHGLLYIEVKIFICDVQK